MVRGLFFMEVPLELCIAQSLHPALAPRFTTPGLQGRSSATDSQTEGKVLTDTLKTED